MDITQKDFDRIVKHFGKKRIIASLPQNEICQVLGLVCLQDLSNEIGVGYDRLRRMMDAGKIPFPEVRILRRSYYTKEEADAIRQKVKQKMPLAPNEKLR